VLVTVGLGPVLVAPVVLGLLLVPVVPGLLLMPVVPGPPVLMLCITISAVIPMTIAIAAITIMVAALPFRLSVRLA